MKSGKTGSRRSRGQPPRPAPARIDAGPPERMARAMFSAVKQPDPSIRIPKRSRKPRLGQFGV